jgi:hypothetical protein
MPDISNWNSQATVQKIEKCSESLPIVGIKQIFLISKADLTNTSKSVKKLIIFGAFFIHFQTKI